MLDVIVKTLDGKNKSFSVPDDVRKNLYFNINVMMFKYSLEI